jgi:hypothetical protein
METQILIAALFLPLFPLSMVFNIVFDKLRGPVPRLILLGVWPQIGLWLMKGSFEIIPNWVVDLALFTSLLYGFRALVLRELVHWVSFLATSIWAVLWISMGFTNDMTTLSLLALGSSLPLGILTLLGDHLKKQFGASYAGLYNGLGHSMPRLSGLLVITMLAVVATPVFPGFTTMMTAILAATTSSLWGSITLCLIWLMWGWAGARLVQGFVIGKESGEELRDISSGLAWVYAFLLTGLGVFGINLISRLS